MSTSREYSKKILKLLAEKPALSISDMGHIGPEIALKRSLKGLSDTGLIERHNSGQNEYARLTKTGKKKVHSLKLDNDTTLVDPTWDNKWRIVLLDLPETRKDEREALRYLLKKAGFICLKNSVWISPFPYEHLFTNIKKDFGLTTELMIFVTDNIDAETKQAFFELVK
jgi:phenylacetic acid degradation operon negative regulatory protein